MRRRCEVRRQGKACCQQYLTITCITHICRTVCRSMSSRVLLRPSIQNIAFGCARHSRVQTTRRSFIRQSSYVIAIKKSSIIRTTFPLSSLKNALFLSRPYSFDQRTSGGWVHEHEQQEIDDREGSDLAFLEQRRPSANMGIIHIVMFEFKPTLMHAEVEKVCVKHPIEKNEMPSGCRASLVSS